MYRLVRAEFPYTERKGKKKRPVLLLTDGSYGKYKIVVVAYVISRKGEGLESEIYVKKSVKNGLKKDSVVKLHKLVNISESALKGELGVLPVRLEKEVKGKLKKLFDL